MNKSLIASLVASTVFVAASSAYADGHARWEGVYGGLLGAHASGKTTWSGSGLHDADGAGGFGRSLDGFSTGSDRSATAGGLFLGFNRAVGSALLGAEIDYLRLNQANTVQLDGSEGYIRMQSSLKGVGSVRLRAGIAREKALFFTTAGLAWADSASFRDVNNFFGAEQQFKLGTSFGWAAGAGLEYAISERLALRIEYLHYDFGNQSKSYSNSFIPSERANVSLNSKLDVGRIGLSYAFK